MANTEAPQLKISPLLILTLTKEIRHFNINSLIPWWPQDVFVRLLLLLALPPPGRFHKVYRDKMIQSRSHPSSCNQTLCLFLKSHSSYLKFSISENSQITNFQELHWYFLKWIQRGNGWPSTPHSLFLAFDSPKDTHGFQHKRTSVSIVLSQTQKKSS